VLRIEKSSKTGGSQEIGERDVLNGPLPTGRPEQRHAKRRKNLG
jgi:hypothetical protein